ncbi:S41 family peptidase [Aquimarina spongiae]|uniref:C-terminal processing protease CtpA/Prc, contains a PDZ domain n=1 Tax=Aquimarina spongiae TaxID=570521 RepID=A0A1M6DBG8_9FLAO|nr:S41 family peptidase [Aquimarina spongiae]SHI70515.1 C-terminal processing protease CtpA/Prc, contains a PDZ domain [Aquimarina spongiae]
MNTIKLKLLPLYVFSLLLIFSCSSDDGDPEPVVINNPDEEIDDFIWKGMNFLYLYKTDVPDLQDSKADDENAYRQFLASYDSPESLFQDLRTTNTLQGELEDQFSIIVDDYVAQEENLFGGITKNNGMAFGLGRFSGTDDLFGFVRYVLPGTDAEAKGVTRGDLFTTINGTQLNLSNYRDLLFNGPDIYDVGFNTIENNAFVPANTVTLNKVEYTENPVFISKTIDYQGQKIGYMMYNSFTFAFNKQMNDAFLAFKNEGITDLILDLRYNGGGSVYTATGLASMITGAYTGEIFAKSVFNPDYTAFINQFSNADDFLTDRFFDNIIIDISDNDVITSEPVNSLGLSRLHVLASGSSASASELIINSLSSYIDVIQIGTSTLGKFQASRLVYDSPDFRRDDANPNHTYAMQPLVSKVANKDDVTDFILGLPADVVFQEDFRNMGVLGEVDEPHLNVALEYIVNNTTAAARSKDFVDFELVGESKMNSPSYQRMYIDNIPLEGRN